MARETLSCSQVLRRQSRDLCSETFEKEVRSHRSNTLPIAGGDCYAGYCSKYCAFLSCLDIDTRVSSHSRSSCTFPLERFLLFRFLTCVIGRVNTRGEVYFFCFSPCQCTAIACALVYKGRS